MPPDRQRLRQIDELFQQALALEDGDRPAFLAAACGEDEALRREVELLLALSAREVDTMLGPVAAFVADVAAVAVPPTDATQSPEEGSPDELAVGETVGAYRVVGPLGRGGMAAVYLAERIDGGFEQQVAIKVLPRSRSAEAIRRFEQERQILARLEHPNIARLIDGGVDRRGLPFLVMERVVGQPVDAYCDARRATVEERIRLVIAAAEALQAAHRNLVVHRDLKPSNLMVSERGEVKLLDFGIAKLLDESGEDLALTVADARPMTPTYASPEQVTGQAITTASDVYQLGLLLYELLTGHRPQPGREVSLAALVRAICETPPVPPSRAFREARAGATPERIAELRQTTPGRLSRRLRGELDAIVARALEKDPQRRYPSAELLALDLERYMAGLPVEARRGGTWYRAGKWVRRHAAAATLGVLAVVLTVGWAVAATLQTRALLRERERTAVEAAKAAEVERFLVGLFQVSDPSVARGEQVTARELLARGLERVEQELAGQPEVQARILGTLAHIHTELGLYTTGEELATRALEQTRRLAPGPSLEVATAAERLAVARRLQGDNGAAEPLLVEALELRRRLAPGSATLADTLAELGHLRLGKGDIGGAEALYREGLALRRALGDRAGVADSLESLGLILNDRGEPAAAETMFREALAENLAVHGERHLHVVSNLFNLGLALQGQKRFEEAHPFFLRALALDRELLGESHPEVGVDLLLVANNADMLRDLAAAEEALLAARTIFEASLPAEHPRRIDALQALGQLRLTQGRPAEAEELLRTVVDARRARYGVDHPFVARALLPLGWSLEKLGRRDEARAVWSEARAMTVGREVQLTERLDGELARLGQD